PQTAWHEMQDRKDEDIDEKSGDDIAQQAKRGKRASPAQKRQANGRRRNEAQRSAPEPDPTPAEALGADLRDWPAASVVLARAVRAKLGQWRADGDYYVPTWKRKHLHMGKDFVELRNGNGGGRRIIANGQVNLDTLRDILEHENGLHENVLWVLH